MLLSNIRRILGGGLVADSAAVALDIATVDLDLRRIHDALAHGDDETAVVAYAGPILPEDAYEDWAAVKQEPVLPDMDKDDEHCLDQRNGTRRHEPASPGIAPSRFEGGGCHQVS